MSSNSNDSEVEKPLESETSIQQATDPKFQPSTSSDVAQQILSLLGAAENGDLSIINEILATADRQVLVNPETWQNNDTPLHRASLRDSLEALELLWPIMSSLATQLNANQMAAIHVAAQNNSCRVTKFLVEKERSLLDLKGGEFGRSPLHYAAEKGHNEMVDLLIDLGAEIQSHSIKMDPLQLPKVYIATRPVNDVEKWDMPINLAAYNGHWGVVELLGREILTFGSHPMHSAALGGQISVFKYFLRNKSINVDLPEGNFSRTSLHLASERGHSNLVQYLVETKNANCNAKSNMEDDEDLPIHLAAFAGQLPIVDYFLEKQPDLIDAEDVQGNRPIHKACLGGQIEVVDLILSKEPDTVELRQECFARTPLHSAAASGHLELVKLLVEKYNANLYAKSNRDDYEVLPIHRAAYCGHLPIIEYFLERQPDLIDSIDLQGNQPIHQACLGGQVEVVDYFLSKRGVKVEIRNEISGCTPLHCTADNGHVDLMKVLVKKFKANVFAKSNKDHYELLPIHLAASFGHLSIIEYLLEQQPDLIDAEDIQGNRPMHWAALGGQIEVVDYFLSKPGSSVELRNDRSGRTPLHQVAMKGNLALATLLVEKYEADVFAKSNKHDYEVMPIHLASYYGQIAIIDYLIDKQFDLIDAKDIQGNRPIHWACLGGQIEVVDYFLSNRGVNVELRQDSFGRKALHQAARKGHLELVKLLVDKYNARITTRCNKKGDESMAIHLAAQYGHLPIVEYFLEKQPDLIDAKDLEGNRPIHKAALTGQIEIVDYLLSKRPNDVEVRNDVFGRTPLHQSVLDGHLDVAKLLVEKFKANCNAKSNKDDGEDMPIQLAASFGHLSIIEYFLEKQPSLIEAKDIQGNRLIHKAALGGQIEVVEYFLSKRGVNVELCNDRYGRTALHQASRQGHLKIVKLLVEKYKANVYARSNKDDAEMLPVHFAARQGRLGVVKYFVEAYSSLASVKDKNGYTPLSWAKRSRTLNEAPQVVDYLKSKIGSK